MSFSIGQQHVESGSGKIVLAFTFPTTAFRVSIGFKPVVVGGAEIMIGMWEADGQKPLRGDSDHDVDGADLRISSRVKHRKGTQVF